MDIGKSLSIARKDINEVFSSIDIYGPMIGVPLFFSLLLPILTFYVAENSASTLAGRILASSAVAAGTSPANAYLFMSFFAVNVLGPIFLTMPILTASVIAADSFAGEKERRTSEALLATPVNRSELLFGKVLASLIPTVILTVCVFGLYGWTVNYLAFVYFQAYILPTAPWLLMLLASPFLALVTIGIVVWVSSHVKGIKQAQQISTLLVLPVLVMPFVSILGIATLTITFFLWLILLLVVLDIVVLYLAVRSFRKEAIL